jgi:hypothetical protein
MHSRCISTALVKLRSIVVQRQQREYLDAEVQPRQGLGGLSLIGPRLQYLLEPLDCLQHVSDCNTSVIAA